MFLLWCRQVDLRLRASSGPHEWGAEFKQLIQEVRSWPHEEKR